MSSRISITLLICMLGAAVAIGALFLPARDVASPTPEPGYAITETLTDDSSDSGGSDSSQPVAVSIEAFTFTDPGRVAAGQEIVVTNNDSVPHTLTADDGSFDTGLLQPGESAVIAAPATGGAFSFFCEVHPSMTGVLDVAA